jgi:hypothetical protein
VYGDRLYAAGQFTTAGGLTRNRLAAIDTAGTGSVKPWNPNADALVLSIAAAGDRIYAAGNFGSVSGTSRNRLAAIDTVGTGALKAWNPNSIGSTSAIAINGSRVYITGSFGTGSNVRNGLAAIDTVGSGTMSAWNPNVASTINTLLVNDYTVYVGGAFTSVGSVASRRYLVPLIDSTVCAAPPSLFVSATSSCANREYGSINLTATGTGGTLAYNWAGPNSFASTTQNLANLAPGSYTVTVSEGCGYSTSNVLVPAITPLVTAISVAGPAPFCYLTEAAFTASGTNLGTAPTYTWYRNGVEVPDTTAATYSTSSISKDTNETIFVRVRNIGGCVTDTVVSSVPLVVRAMYTAPPALSSSVVPSCPYNSHGGVIDLTATGSGGALGYSWTGPGGFTANTEDISNLAPGSYTVTVNEGCGQSLASVQIADAAPVSPVVTVNTPSNICLNIPATFTVDTANVGSAPTYEWFFNGTSVSTSNTYVAPHIDVLDQDTLYVVVRDINGCKTDTTITSPLLTTLLSNYAPDGTVNYATTSGSTKLCSGDMTTFTSKASLSAKATGASYEWYKDGNIIGGQTMPTYITGDAGAYTVKVTYTNGCTRMSSSARVINPTPNAFAAVQGGATPEFCTGQSITLKATPVSGATYRWKLNGNVNKGTANTLVVKVGGAYTVISGKNGCADTSLPLTVTEHTTDVSLSTIGATSLCTPDFVTIAAAENPGYTYQWYKGSALMPIETGSSFSTITSGKYRVSIQNGTCPPKKSAVISVDATTTPSASITCTATLPVFWKLTAAPGGSGYTYQWYKNNVALADSVNKDLYANKDGVYKVAVSKNGCMDMSDPYLVLSSTFKNTVNLTEEAINISIFPNPSEGVFNIGFEKPVSIVAKDMWGRTVAESKNVSQIDLSNYSAGMYMIMVTSLDGNLLKVERVVKK